MGRRAGAVLALWLLLGAAAAAFKAVAGDEAPHKPARGIAGGRSPSLRAPGLPAILTFRSAVMPAARIANFFFESTKRPGPGSRGQAPVSCLLIRTTHPVTLTLNASLGLFFTRNVSR